MEQKNTIVKCNSTTCFYNYKGICNQSVIDLDMYGQCNDYVECEKTEAPAKLKSDLNYGLDEVLSVEMKVASEGENKNKTIISFKNGSTLECLKPDQKVVRGHRANFPMFEDGVPQDVINEICRPFKYHTKTNRLQGYLGMCMWCDYHRSNCGCAHKNPDIDEELRTCHSVKSTGANQ